MKQELNKEFFEKKVKKNQVKLIISLVLLVGLGILATVLMNQFINEFTVVVTEISEGLGPDAEFTEEEIMPYIENGSLNLANFGYSLLCGFISFISFFVTIANGIKLSKSKKELAKYVKEF